MKALAKLERAPGLTLTRVRKPEVGHNDVMIRIRKTAICGTDIHIWKWDDWAQKTIPVPMHVGHEYVGTVEAMGQEVRGFAIGDRVSGEGHITCGFCRNCRAGRRHLCRNTRGVGVNREGAFGYVATLFGRRRYIPELQDRNRSVRSFGERTAMNSPMQGSAADLLKVAMIRLATALGAQALRSVLLLQVHDELVLEAPEPEVEIVGSLVREHMERAGHLRVPLVVDVGVGDNWMDAKP